eukprot:6173396-Pleurochrysis_carterae.AAC.2
MAVGSDEHRSVYAAAMAKMPTAGCTVVEASSTKEQVINAHDAAMQQCNACDAAPPSIAPKGQASAIGTR